MSSFYVEPFLDSKQRHITRENCTIANFSVILMQQTAIHRSPFFFEFFVFLHRSSWRRQGVTSFMGVKVTPSNPFHSSVATGSLRAVSNWLNNSKPKLLFFQHYFDLLLRSTITTIFQGNIFGTNWRIIWMFQAFEIYFWNCHHHHHHSVFVKTMSS